MLGRSGAGRTEREHQFRCSRFSWSFHVGRPLGTLHGFPAPLPQVLCPDLRLGAGEVGIAAEGAAGPAQPERHLLYDLPKALRLFLPDLGAIVALGATVQAFLHRARSSAVEHLVFRPLLLGTGT